MGIKVDIPSYASITLGTIGVPPLQMAEAYSTLANNGIHRDAVAITKIEDRNNNTVYEHKEQATQAISGEVAYATTQVLQGVVNSGTATAVRSYSRHVNQPIAGKTGTTENARDLWFVGYTPQTTVAVWTGFREEKTIYVYGSAGHPSNTSCPIFGRYLDLTLGGVARQEFTSSPAPSYKPSSAWAFAKSQKPETPAQTTEETPQTEQPEEEQTYPVDSHTTNATPDNNPPDTAAAGD